jgi:hypothetical protein
MSGPKYAKVDPADYKRLRKYKYIAKKGRNCFYAQILEPKVETGKKLPMHMHQMILEVPKGMVVDHINYDGMDNRNANLRAATRAQNSRNRKKFFKSDGSKQSKYKGVSWHKKTDKWMAAITFNTKHIYLGLFENDIDAAKAYDEASKKYHGEFGRLNFPELG